MWEVKVNAAMLHQDLPLCRLQHSLVSIHSFKKCFKGKLRRYQQVWAVGWQQILQFSFLPLFLHFFSIHWKTWARSDM